MFVDHVGIAFFPEIIFLRIIGRIAFPIFAYQIFQGFIYTSNFIKYLKRIWIFALISQVPYTLFFDSTTLNVLFPFALSLLLLQSVKMHRYSWIPLIVTISLLIPMDYGFFGVVLPFLFYILKNNKNFAFLIQVLAITLYSIWLQWDIQYFAIIGSFIVLYFPANKLNIRLNKYIFYWFYPIHIIVLFVANLIY